MAVMKTILHSSSSSNNNNNNNNSNSSSSSLQKASQINQLMSDLNQNVLYTTRAARVAMFSVVYVCVFICLSAP